ncbi:MAG: helix-turn-helix transcriptional regulator [Methyloceanibacter sp.]
MSRLPISPKQLLISRKTAAEMLDTSVDTIKRLERQGRLHPVRLTGPRSSIFFRAEEVHSLTEADVGGADNEVTA